MLLLLAVVLLAQRAVTKYFAPTLLRPLDSELDPEVLRALRAAPLKTLEEEVGLLGVAKAGLAACHPPAVLKWHCSR